MLAGEEPPALLTCMLVCWDWFGMLRCPHNVRLVATGVVPTDPVLSPKSGVVFERRAIEKHLEHTGTDPVNGADLKKDELIAVKTSTVVAPRPAGLTSIPSVLQVMQSEWDSLMLETYSLKQHLHLVRQELAPVSYTHLTLPTNREV